MAKKDYRKDDDTYPVDVIKPKEEEKVVEEPKKANKKVYEDDDIVTYKIRLKNGKVVEQSNKYWYYKHLKKDGKVVGE